MANSDSFIYPQWNAPEDVKAVFTTRYGGCSKAPFDEFNLACHVGDNPSAVELNRNVLSKELGLEKVQWLEQVHGTDVYSVKDVSEHVIADACYTWQSDLACAVMTADCLPVLFCNKQGSEVAAAHAGWRGLAAGVLVNTVNSFTVPPEELMACFGPCIGPCHFEVGQDVVDAFMQAEVFKNIESLELLAFRKTGVVGKYLADLQLLAKLQLHQLGVTDVIENSWCTVCDDEFFSYRQNSSTGRMASLIYMP